MAGGTRPLLVIGGAAVLVLAGLAGINSGEYTLTLALGALLATGVGGVFVLYSGSPASNRRSLAVSKSAGQAGTSTPEDSSNLPDPLEQQIDMPL